MIRPVMKVHSEQEFTPYIRACAANRKASFQ